MSSTASETENRPNEDVLKDTEEECLNADESQVQNRSTSDSPKSDGKEIEQQQQQPQEQEEQTCAPVDASADSNPEAICLDDEAVLEPDQDRKIFVGGLNYRTTEESLRTHFAECGKILDCIVMFDQSGRSRGFGFVTFESSAVVDKVMSQRPHMIDGREVDVKRATPKERNEANGSTGGGYEEQNPKATYYQQCQKASVKKIFIGAIRDGIDEEDLRTYFSSFGNVVDCIIMRDADGRLRGFGFLEFDDCDPVDKVVLERHHVVKGKTLDVKKAVPRGGSSEHSTSQPAYHYAPYGPSHYGAYSYRHRYISPSYGGGYVSPRFGDASYRHQQQYYPAAAAAQQASVVDWGGMYNRNGQQYAADFDYSSSSAYGAPQQMMQQQSFGADQMYPEMVQRAQPGADYWASQQGPNGRYNMDTMNYPPSNYPAGYGMTYAGGQYSSDADGSAVPDGSSQYQNQAATEYGGYAADGYYPQTGAYSVGAPYGTYGAAAAATNENSIPTSGYMDNSNYAASGANRVPAFQPGDASASAGNQYMPTYGTYATSQSMMGAGTR